MGRRAFSSQLAEASGLPKDRLPSTETEARKAQETLESDLLNLSLDDQEKLLFEIHGLPCSTIDDNAVGDLNEKLEDMERELDGPMSDKKSAYDRALYMNPEYVNNLKRLFLRFVEYDPLLAADQIVQHFETKRSLFGDGFVLGRGLLYSDLSKEDFEHLENSSIQILPSRDAAGRVVVFCAPGCGKQGFSDSMIRAAWYFQQALLREEGVAEHGYVQVNYNMGKYGREISLEDMETISNKLVDGCFMRMAVEHFCYDDPGMKNWVAGGALFSDESYRHRLRCHFGSKSDVLFKLQTFGIPTQDFPINDEETLDLRWHRQWMEIQRKADADLSSQIFLAPRKFDVLFGRGRDVRVHSGNLHAKHIVDTRYDEYEVACKQDKTRIAEEVIAVIHESFGRFLKWEEEKGWVEVEFEVARDKVAHFFRRRRIASSDTAADKSSCSP